jgi:hypothetical protein
MARTLASCSYSSAKKPARRSELRPCNRDNALLDSQCHNTGKCVYLLTPWVSVTFYASHYDSCSSVLTLCPRKLMITNPPNGTELEEVDLLRQRLSGTLETSLLRMYSGPSQLLAETTSQADPSARTRCNLAAFVCVRSVYWLA